MTSYAQRSTMPAIAWKWKHSCRKRWAKRLKHSSMPPPADTIWSLLMDAHQANWIRRPLHGKHSQHLAEIKKNRLSKWKWTNRSFQCNKNIERRSICYAHCCTEDRVSLLKSLPFTLENGIYFSLLLFAEHSTRTMRRLCLFWMPATVG